MLDIEIQSILLQKDTMIHLQRDIIEELQRIVKFQQAKLNYMEATQELLQNNEKCDTVSVDQMQLKL